MRRLIWWGTAMNLLSLKKSFLNNFDIEWNLSWHDVSLRFDVVPIFTYQQTMQSLYLNGHLMRPYLPSNAAMIWSLYIFMYIWVLHSLKETARYKCIWGNLTWKCCNSHNASNRYGRCFIHKCTSIILYYTCSCKLPLYRLVTLNVWKQF